jgi:hypothetical protein
MVTKEDSTTSLLSYSFLKYMTTIIMSTVDFIFIFTISKKVILRWIWGDKTTLIFKLKLKLNKRKRNDG